MGLAVLPTVAFALPVECMCVAALHQLAGVNIRGDADTLSPNTPFENLEAGDVLLMRYGNVYHAALIISYSGAVALPSEGIVVPKTITIEEWNYVHCKHTIRTLAFNDEHIRGIYTPYAMTTS